MSNGNGNGNGYAKNEVARLVVQLALTVAFGSWAYQVAELKEGVNDAAQLVRQEMKEMHDEISSVQKEVSGHSSAIAECKARLEMHGHWDQGTKPTRRGGPVQPEE